MLVGELLAKHGYTVNYTFNFNPDSNYLWLCTDGTISIDLSPEDFIQYINTTFSDCLNISAQDKVLSISAKQNMCSSADKFFCGNGPADLITKGIEAALTSWNLAKKSCAPVQK